MQIKGVILDMRGTNGGTVQGALDLASAFVDIGPFAVKVEGNGRFLHKETIGVTPPLAYTLPGDAKALTATTSIKSPNGGMLVFASADYVTPEGVNLAQKGTPADMVVAHARGSRADEAMFVAANQ